MEAHQRGTRRQEEVTCKGCRPKTEARRNTGSYRGLIRGFKRSPDVVPPLSALFFLALGVVNAVAAEEPLNKVVGLGEACDAAAGIVCKSGLECSASNLTSQECVRIRHPAHPTRKFRSGSPRTVSRFRVGLVKEGKTSGRANCALCIAAFGPSEPLGLVHGIRRQRGGGETCREWAVTGSSSSGLACSRQGRVQASGADWWVGTS